MTTSRALVKQTLEFKSPKRVPRHLWWLDWAKYHYPNEFKQIQERFPDDIITAPGFHKTQPTTSGSPTEVGTYIDEWGCVFTNLQRGVIGEVKQPFIKDWDDLSKLSPPEELLTIDVDQINAFCRNTDRFVMGGALPRPFERMQFLRSSQNLYIDLAENSPQLQELIHIVHGYFLKELEVWAKTDVDALMFMDDWGAQRALLISPKQWRKIFKPLYKEYIDIAHAHGKYIFMHSDGYIRDILPDLVELGLDAVNSQLFIMDIEEIGRSFAGKITFWGEIDRQHLLPHGSVEDIAAAVRRVKNALYADGGVIAQCEFGPGAKPENVYAVFKTWEELVS